MSGDKKPTSSTPPGPPGPAGKGRRGRKTGQNAHTPTPIPQHVLDRAWRTTEEALFNPPMPPRYRARYERLAREADARKKAEGDGTDDERD